MLNGILKIGEAGQIGVPSMMLVQQYIIVQANWISSLCASTGIMLRGKREPQFSKV
jgi:hypothetical protein